MTNRTAGERQTTPQDHGRSRYARVGWRSLRCSRRLLLLLMQYRRRRRWRLLNARQPGSYGLPGAARGKRRARAPPAPQPPGGSPRRPWHSRGDPVLSRSWCLPACPPGGAEQEPECLAGLGDPSTEGSLGRVELHLRRPQACSIVGTKASRYLLVPPATLPSCPALRRARGVGVRTPAALPWPCLALPHLAALPARTPGQRSDDAAGGCPVHHPAVPPVDVGVRGGCAPSPPPCGCSPSGRPPVGERPPHGPPSPAQPSPATRRLVLPRSRRSPNGFHARHAALAKTSIPPSIPPAPFPPSLPFLPLTHTTNLVELQHTQSFASAVHTGQAIANPFVLGEHSTRNSIPRPLSCVKPRCCTAVSSTTSPPLTLTSRHVPTPRSGHPTSDYSCTHQPQIAHLHPFGPTPLGAVSSTPEQLGCMSRRARILPAIAAADALAHALAHAIVPAAPCHRQ